MYVRLPDSSPLFFSVCVSQFIVSSFAEPRERFLYKMCEFIASLDFNLKLMHYVLVFIAREHTEGEKKRQEEGVAMSDESAKVFHTLRSMILI